MASGLPATPLKKISMVRIAHVYYKHKNIDEAKRFAEDFGFAQTSEVGKKTYFRGYGTEPFVLCLEASNEDEFGGAAFVVESMEDLMQAAKTLPNECKATDIYDLTDAPGGGKCVTFYDPVDKFPFHLVYGQSPVEARDVDFPIVRFNFVSHRLSSSSYSYEMIR